MTAFNLTIVATLPDGLLIEQACPADNDAAWRTIGMLTECLQWRDLATIEWTARLTEPPPKPVENPTPAPATA